MGAPASQVVPRRLKQPMLDIGDGKRRGYGLVQQARMEIIYVRCSKALVRLSVKHSLLKSEIKLTIQMCLKTTQAMIEFLPHHEMSCWTEQFDLIAKTLKKLVADKAVSRGL